MASISRIRAARALSLIGHPALLVPGAVVQGGSVREAPAPILLVATSVAILLALIVVGYSLVQVRAGHWSHIDASLPQERSQLNLFVATLLFATAAVLWSLGQPPAIAIGLALGGALVMFAHLLRRWLKVSLHAGFAAFSTLLLWPSYPGMLFLLLLAAGVAWSRLVLLRHTLHEVALGLLAGVAAGLAFNVLAG
ncbi:phosphoesterase [Accumulibacter sp.]|uniref:Phosphoesterase n=1 Tax=Candidatus Accumulibacter proximus TaxID=2954385 RepID=A0A935Q2R1_9PROT|nr:phosphoesterase [Accumulibacter sp.]MBK7676967.1 phosphoesterase [Candidatus Accumulibacter proximus]MBL8374696.1 phosphoesterase [Accumulibacter sp.]